MGQPEFNDKMNTSMEKRNAFQANPKNLEMISEMMRTAPKKLTEKLSQWQWFFELHQTPEHAQKLRTAIAELENKISEKKNFEKEGYIDPTTTTFKKSSRAQMSTAMSVEPDEQLRKAYFQGLESTAATAVKEYIELVTLRNQYAKALGYDDFYAYKSEHEDNMTKSELFGIFDTLYDQTNYAFDDIRELEKTKKGLRKPWNFGYMMAGDFTQREDQYFQLENALEYWGRAFSNMGINMDGGKIQLDLVSRTGKYNNGFCHWPDVVKYEDGKKIPGSANFTCNAVIGQVGSGSIAMNTLFHEGGHAAHFLNSQQTEVCMNTEFLPMTSAWAETHSMILDSVFSSIEWKTRYAKNADGEFYPFELFKEKVNKLQPLMPMRMMSISAVMSFERDIYETKDLTEKKVLSLAKKNFKKYFDRSVDSLWLLAVPHIYSFDSSCSYHGYGLAELALTQWKEYFYKKYGHIIDNKKIGKEMKQVWKLGASKTFPEFVKLATGKNLSPKAFIKKVTQTPQQIIKTAKKRIKYLETIKKPKGAIDLKSDITMVHGTKKICNNKNSFEDMTEKYEKWIKKQA
jgi:hypothetical protein